MLKVGAKSMVFGRLDAQAQQSRRRRPAEDPRSLNLPFDANRSWFANSEGVRIQPVTFAMPTERIAALNKPGERASDPSS